MGATEVNQTEFAEQLGLTTRQIRNLERKGLPHRASGNQKLYPLPEALQWYIQHKIDAELDSREITGLKEAQAEKVATETALLKLKLAREKGRTVYAEHVDEVALRIVERIRPRLLVLPSICAPQLVGLETVAEIHELLMRQVREILTNLARTAGDLVQDDGARSLDPSEPLPDDFPGRRHLAAQGIDTLEELLALGDPTVVKGIGPVTAKAISEELGVEL